MYSCLHCTPIRSSLPVNLNPAILAAPVNTKPHTFHIPGIPNYFQIIPLLLQIEANFHWPQPTKPTPILPGLEEFNYRIAGHNEE